MFAEGTSSSTLDQALSASNGLPNGSLHSLGRPEHPFAATPAKPQQQALCLLFGGFTGGGVDGSLLALDAGNRIPRPLCLKRIPLLHLQMEQPHGPEDCLHTMA